MDYLKEYRVTREYPYRECTKFPDFEVRQGHYVTARNAEEALQIMAKRFPEDVTAGYWFALKHWRDIG
jgi:hypothetical protein